MQKKRPEFPVFLQRVEIQLFLRGFCGLPLGGANGRVVHDRGTDHDGSVSTDDDTDAEGDGKTPDGLTAPDRDGDHREEGRDGGVDRTGKGRVESGVGVLLEVCIGVQGPVFTDTVEDNDVIVDCVTDDGQDSRDEGLVDVEVEREDTREQREEADDDDRHRRVPTSSP